MPLAVQISGAYQPDVKELIPLVESIPPIRGKPGRPLQRPDCLLADPAYDSQFHRRYLLKKGICTLLAKRRVENDPRVNQHRCERTLS